MGTPFLSQHRCLSLSKRKGCVGAGRALLLSLGLGALTKSSSFLVASSAESSWATKALGDTCLTLPGTCKSFHGLGSSDPKPSACLGRGSEAGFR